MLPAPVIKDAPDRGPVDAIGIGQVIEHALLTTESLNKIFIFCQSTNFPH